MRERGGIARSGERRSGERARGGGAALPRRTARRIVSPMRTSRRRVLCAALAGAVPCVALAQPADLLLTNARVWTGDSARPWAAAVAVRGERILAVGSLADVARHQAASTRVRDLRGAFVAPGFIDNHTHFDQAGALLLGVNLLDVADEAGLARRVR